MELRPYQRFAVGEARQLKSTHLGSLLLVCPTGGGKTVIGSVIVEEHLRYGLGGERVVWLAHREELISQAAEKLRAQGLEVGIIRGGVRETPEAPVQVASVASLTRRLDRLEGASLVVVDEAHHVTDSNSYARILNAAPLAMRLGLTATPWRLDGKGLADTFKNHHVVCEPKRLRDEGYLCGLEGYEYQCAALNAVRIRGGDYDLGQLEAAMDNWQLYGDVIGEWKRHAGNARTIAYCVTVRHSAKLAEIFREAGIPAEHLDGTTPEAERAAVLARLRSGETRVVCNVAVLTEGFDCPPVGCIIMARPTLSETLHLQMVGRALRPCCYDCQGEALTTAEVCGKCGSRNLKRMARLHDHAGNWKRHGGPYRWRDWSPRVDRDQTRGGGGNYAARESDEPSAEVARGVMHLEAKRRELVDRDEPRPSKKAGGGWMVACPGCGEMRMALASAALTPHRRWITENGRHLEVPCDDPRVRAA